MRLFARLRRLSPVVGAVVALGLLAACTLHRQAGTGDVAFRLAWEGESDLDLIVQDPAGHCINFGSGTSPTGGLLDVDCNSGSGRLCPAPVENIYWPHGSAPSGRYLFWAHAHALIPAEAPLSYQLQVLRGTEVVRLIRGRVRKHQERHGAWALDLPSGRVSAPEQNRSAADSPCVSIRSGILKSSG
jgi:hypothetical protein